MAEVTPRLYDLCTPGEKKIAQLKLVMVLFALVQRPDGFRGRRGVRYIDSTAALMALIRGRSDREDVARLAQVIHLCLISLRTWIYWEWIQSKANWADAISRLGYDYDDPWHLCRGFSTERATLRFEVWRLPL